jgi:hypothetical protein
MSRFLRHPVIANTPWVDSSRAIKLRSFSTLAVAAIGFNSLSDDLPRGGDKL